MILASLEVANFRKFRAPLRLDAFTAGLNVVIEPNETGKSTLLEALRAAFFIRHSAKTELVRSYVPLGDDVAPQVNVDFLIDGTLWKLEKRFLRSPFVRLTGAGGRRDNDAAEEALQDLLGFERGNNRGSDPETRGPLGLLWVEQATALAVEAPNRIVRDTVRGVLEAEVGAVTGGRRFDSIRANVEEAYTVLRSARAGQSRGELAAAENRLADAVQVRVAADAALRGYEQSLAELDDATARLRIVERDLADPQLAEDRRKFEDDLKIAEQTALRVSAAEAQHGRCEEIVRTAEARIARLDGAEKRLALAVEAAAKHATAYDDARGATEAAAVDEAALRASLADGRRNREEREATLAAVRRQAQAFAEAAAVRRAITARDALAALEERERGLAAEAATAIAPADLNGLAALERRAIEARARFEAGVVRVEFDLASGVPLMIDGAASGSAAIDVLSVTRLDFGDAGGLVIRPPAGVGRSVEADHAAAEADLAATLARLAVASHAAAVARSERAAAAGRELKTVQAQIAAACPGDPTIGLSKGAAALHGFVAARGREVVAVDAPADDVGALEAAVDDARVAEAVAAGRHEDSRHALSRAETRGAASATERAAAAREEEAATGHLRDVIAEGDREALTAALAEARRERAGWHEALEQARAGAAAFDRDAIRRRIENLSRATARAGEERVQLAGRVASLEATIAREGKIGPAGEAAAAQEEEIAATAALERLRHEADVLETLRGALTEAAGEASRTFLAPVTRRAARYIERLLPGSAAAFDEELGLNALKRGGVDEATAGLSRGTQEQLAILTRLAFADLLLEDGAPICLILDDPLVYSDDARLEVMTDILQDAAKRMQVILLTCRSKAFRHVEANRIVLR